MLIFGIVVDVETLVLLFLEVPLLAMAFELLLLGTGVAIVFCWTGSPRRSTSGTRAVLGVVLGGIVDPTFVLGTRAVGTGGGLLILVVGVPIARAFDEAASFADFSRICLCFDSSLARMDTKSSGIGLFS